jgi:ankyrin repeat protein
VENEKVDTFMEAVRRGDRKAINSLLKEGFSLLERDSESWTALHWATEMGYKDLVIQFLDRDPLLLNMKTKEGLSPINIAAWRGDKGMIELLIEQGAEIDDRTKWGEVPLHHAVTFGHSEICDVLLKNGADPFAEDRLKRTPFMIAMQKGSPRIRSIFEQYRQPPKPSE